MFRRFRIVLVFSCVFCMPAMIPEQESEYNILLIYLAKREKRAGGKHCLKNTLFILRSTLAFTLTVSLFIVHDDGFVINVIKMFSQTWEKLSPLKSAWKWKWNCLFGFPPFFSSYVTCLTFEKRIFSIFGEHKDENSIFLFYLPSHRARLSHIILYFTLFSCTQKCVLLSWTYKWNEDLKSRCDFVAKNNISHRSSGWRRSFFRSRNGFIFVEFWIKIV